MTIAQIGMANVEHEWPDTGCVESPTCLNCPLPFCKHDDPGRYASLVARRRQADMVAAMGRYLTTHHNGADTITDVTEQVGREFGVHPRTVWRAWSNSSKESA